MSSSTSGVELATETGNSRTEEAAAVSVSPDVVCTRSRVSHDGRAPNPFSAPGLNDLPLGRSCVLTRASEDLWTAAFREAIETFEPKLDVAQLADANVERMLHDLELIDRLNNDDSIFQRGLEHLRRVKGPLENLKLALNLAEPLVSFEPVAATVIGVVRSVTTVCSVCEESSLAHDQASRCEVSALANPLVGRHRPCER